MPFQQFTDLEVYKACRNLRIKIAKLAMQFPDPEKHRLTDQIIRSSRSVTACIAEGHGRFYYKENISFCRKSRGSLNETFEHLITAIDNGLLNQEELKAYKLEIGTCGKLLNGYI